MSTANGLPYCQICQRDTDIVVLKYSPKHPRDWQIRTASGPISRSVQEPPYVFYRCDGGVRHSMPHEAWVQVGETYQPPAATEFEIHDA